MLNFHNREADREKGKAKGSLVANETIELLPSFFTWTVERVKLIQETTLTLIIKLCEYGRKVRCWIRSLTVVPQVGEGFFTLKRRKLND